MSLTKWLLGLLLLIAIPNKAKAYGVLNLDYFNIEAIKLYPGAQDLMLSAPYNLPNDSPTNRLDLDFRVKFIDYIFWENLVHTATDEHQFREVGWQFKVGTDVLDPIDIFYYHHSQHWLDNASGHMFPIEDGIGIRLRVVK